MTTFWLWVCAGCAASAAIGFSFTRFAVSELPKFRAVDPQSTPVWAELPQDVIRLDPTAPVAAGNVEPPPAPAAPLELAEEPRVPQARAAPRPRVKSTKSAAAKHRAAPPRSPAPTSPEPDAAKLTLWARQIKAGERKMSIATDGCRVTWDRRCKHGHPSWLVRLGYLKRPRQPYPRHTPR